MQVTKLKFYHLTPVCAEDQVDVASRDEEGEAIKNEQDEIIFTKRPLKTFADFITYAKEKYPNFNEKQHSILVKDFGECLLDEAIQKLLEPTEIEVKTGTQTEIVKTMLGNIVVTSDIVKKVTRPKLRGVTFAFDENGNCDFSICIFPDEYSREKGRQTAAGRVANRFYKAKNKKKILVGEYLFILDPKEEIPLQVGNPEKPTTLFLSAKTPISEVAAFYRYLKETEKADETMQSAL